MSPSPDVPLSADGSQVLAPCDPGDRSDVRLQHDDSGATGSSPSRPRRSGSASLLTRAFAIDITVCRKCGDRTRVVARVRRGGRRSRPATATTCSASRSPSPTVRRDSVQPGDSVRVRGGARAGRHQQWRPKAATSWADSAADSNLPGAHGSIGRHDEPAPVHRRFARERLAASDQSLSRIDVAVCRKCGGRIRVLAVVTISGAGSGDGGATRSGVPRGLARAVDARAAASSKS